MTRIIRDLVAAPIHARMSVDTELKTVFVDGLKERASLDRLIDELVTRRPAMVVTTSHGQTGPTNDAVAMLASLGLILDQAVVPLKPQQLIERWNPGGAIWYSHACCSVGSDARTSFENLLPGGSTPDRVVKAVARLGSHVSPLPLALLQAEQPIRAFIGHVEPTFDFSLRHPETLTPMTDALQLGLYDGLYRRKPEPIGLALRHYYDRIGEMLAIYHDSLREYNKGKDAEMTPSMVWSLLAANDFKTTVILGDPAVTLPA